MQQSLVHDALTPVPQRAAQIPAVTRREAERINQAEFERFVALLDQLQPGDWNLATDCALWTIRDIVAHQCGSYAFNASTTEMRRQVSPAFIGAYQARGLSLLDARNQAQIDERVGRSPGELIRELRATGEKAFVAMQRLPFFIRWIPIDVEGAGRKPMAYLKDVLVHRDTWTHRLDICRATQREMVLTPEHDGRITALVVRELADIVSPVLGGQTVDLILTGRAGGSWRLGGAAQPSAVIQMNGLVFHRLASGRARLSDLHEQIALQGDQTLAEQVLAHTQVVY